jgi:hypothetical protein
MARVSVEIGGVSLNGAGSAGGSSINGRCVYQEELAPSGTTATMVSAVTAAQVSAGANIARIATDTDVYFAVGTSPDPTLTTSTGASSARRLLSAGSSMEQVIAAGEKVAVHT